jgi:hypothetical protein
MSIGTDIYEGLYESEDLRGTLSSATVEAFPCVSSGIQNDAQNSLLGIGISQGGLIHLLTANEPEGVVVHKAELVFTDSQSQTFNIRITGIKRRMGLTTLTTEAVNP